MKISYDQCFSKTIDLNSTPSEVWRALTETNIMSEWMFDSGIDIITDWKVGNPITIHIQSDSYKTGFENKGMVLQFESERILRYSHLSSLSGLPDEIENYSVIEFILMPNGDLTTLTLTLSNFPTEIIYKHLVFYWEVTLELLKKFIEHGRI